MVEQQTERRKPEKEGVIFLIYKDGRVLLEDRKDPDKSFFGYIIIPGGKVETGIDSNFEEAARREVLEECGVKIKNMIHLDTFLNMSISNNLYHTAAFLITDFEGEVVNRENKANQIWVDINKASNFLAHADSRYILLLAKLRLNEGELKAD